MTAAAIAHHPEAETISMNPVQQVRDIFNADIAVKRRAAAALAGPISGAARVLIGCLAGGHKILTCGNGGSAGDAQHLSSKLLNRFERPRDGYAAIALTTDTSTLTSIANDQAYAEVFARQVLALGRPGDALVAITTSGRSPNIVEAVRAAQRRGMAVVALTGRNGGDVAALLREGDVELRVPSESTPRIQETHIVILHCLCELIDSQTIPWKEDAP